MKIAVITGASRGHGLVLIHEFTQNGWQVIGTGRQDKPADFPVGADYHQFDASDAGACEMFWQEVSKQYQNAEWCLVNNAGGYIPGGLTDTTPEAYMQQMQSCYFSAVYMTRGLALVIPKARIINILSSSALAPAKTDLAYGAAKTAERHFFQSLQQAYSPGQYQITNLYPKSIATHGPDSKAIDPSDLARFTREQADNISTYYIRDATIYPRVN